MTLIDDRVGRRIEIDAAVGRAAVVLHLEGEAGVRRAVTSAGRREPQLADGDVAAEMNWPAVTGVPLCVSAAAAAGSVVILTASSALAGGLSLSGR